MVLDTRLRYVYDVWNRLVKAQSRQDGDVVIQTAEYDGLGRRVQKVVSNSGDLDGTFAFYYDRGWWLLEVRDGSANVVAQVYGGTQYIDEVVAQRSEDGYMVVNQDANRNVVSATDLAGRVLERTFYTAYGLPTFNSETYFGDYDGDGEVDSTDDAELGSGQTCWGASATGACRVFDFDQDGDLDNDDQTVMTSLVALASTNHVRLARTSGTTGGLFAHQGLLLDAEIGQYHNRAREYHAGSARFLQRDIVAFRNGFNVGLHYLDGLNLHDYVQGNPVTRVDPTGLSDCCIEQCNETYRSCSRVILESVTEISKQCQCCDGSVHNIICKVYQRYLHERCTVIEDCRWHRSNNIWCHGVKCPPPVNGRVRELPPTNEFIESGYEECPDCPCEDDCCDSGEM